MASLPNLPSLAALRRKRDHHPVPTDATRSEADLKLRLAHRLQAEDEARRSTSIAPPPGAARS